MNNALLKKAMPHLLAIVIFAVLAMFYCLPAMKGMELEQHDIKQWQGAIQDSKLYAEKNGGVYPLWNKNMFGGMPNFQIGGTVTVVNPAGYLYAILQLGLPKPANFFFLACLCFYIMAMCFKVRPAVGMIISIAYAYATYNPIIIGAGHETKMMTISFMPVILGGIYLILQKKYWLGGVLTAVFSYLTISANHLQMFYYLGFALAFMAIAYIIHYIKEKDFKHLGISFVIAASAVAFGIACNAQSLLSTFEYQKYTQRGGPSELTDTTKKEVSKNGLDKDYAMSYSMYKAEPLVMFTPKLFGGGSPKQYSDGEVDFEVKEESSKALAASQEINQNLAKQLQQQGALPAWYNTYWGGIGGTDGPPYAGAALIALALLGFFFLRNQERWWPIAGLAIICAISAGSYFDAFNGFMYNNFPLFNKFRAPSSALTVAQLMISILAVLGLDRIITSVNDNANKEKSFDDTTKKKILYGIIGVATVIVLSALVIFTQNFISPNETSLLKSLKSSNNLEAESAVKEVMKGLIADRKGLAWSSLGGSLFFALLAISAIWALSRKILSWNVIVPILGVILFADVAITNSHYFNSKKFVNKEENEANFSSPPSDKMVQEDKSDFRVFDRRASTFSDATASYNYRSIGGYHSAKLRIYQDLIENKINMPVLNMLNVKYVLDNQPSADGRSQTPTVQQNANALGSAWFVKAVNFVKNADAEMAALDNLNTKDSAVVQEKFKSKIPFAIESDTAAKISLEKNDYDKVTYTASNTKNAFAVFSEIYYEAGWKAYVDGKETPIVKTNYVLRGLALAPGTHKIEFKFLPEGFAKGTKIGNICAIIMGLLLLSLVYLGYKEYKKNTG